MPLKKYLFISPQPWGKMFLSKHNYAIELSEAGNSVYFLNPPTYTKKLRGISISVREQMPNLFVVDYLLPNAIHVLRFKARGIFDLIIKKSLISQINKLAQFDELWCFEPNIFSSFDPFNAKKKLLFLVDRHENNNLKKLSATADGIATISKLILDFFDFTDKPKLLLNHGLNKNFTRLAKINLKKEPVVMPHRSIKVAYVGNLLQGNRMDYGTMQLIIEQNSEIAFHFYGPYEKSNNTLGSTLSEGLLHFLQFLKDAPNVILHGVLDQTALADQMQEMDLFLTCYNWLTDDNKSSNCHKIIEYLSTGKVVVANRIMTYESTTELLEMPVEYTNENLPGLFKKVTQNLAVYNSPDRQKKRIEFALENTYQSHIKTITDFIASSLAVA